MSNAEPLYMIAADDPYVEEYRELYENMADAEFHTLRVSVNVPYVEEGDCAGVAHNKVFYL